MKKAAIMQPYFFPYAGYISLIKHTDIFVLFDEAQFIRHGWIERNRILKQQEGWLYIKVPLVKHDQQTKIRDITIDSKQAWQEKILAQMVVYKRVAPYYRDVVSLVESVIRTPHATITDLNQHALAVLCQYLSIDTPIKIYSQMDLGLAEVRAPDEWALRICEALGDVDEYWNPPGGQSFFDRSKYAQAGMELRFHQLNTFTYDQGRQPFEPGLSIIDTLMFNSPQETHTILDSYELT